MSELYMESLKEINEQPQLLFFPPALRVSYHEKELLEDIDKGRLNALDFFLSTPKGRCLLGEHVLTEDVFGDFIYTEMLFQRVESLEEVEVVLEEIKEKAKRNEKTSLDTSYFEESWTEWKRKYELKQAVKNGQLSALLESKKWDFKELSFIVNETPESTKVVLPFVGNRDMDLFLNHVHVENSLICNQHAFFEKRENDFFTLLRLIRHNCVLPTAFSLAFYPSVEEIIKNNQEYNGFPSNTWELEGLSSDVFAPFHQLLDEFKTREKVFRIPMEEDYRIVIQELLTPCFEEIETIKEKVGEAQFYSHNEKMVIRACIEMNMIFPHFFKKEMKSVFAQELLEYVPLEQYPIEMKALIEEEHFDNLQLIKYQKGYISMPDNIRYRLNGYGDNPTDDLLDEFFLEYEIADFWKRVARDEKLWHYALEQEGDILLELFYQNKGLEVIIWESSEEIQRKLRKVGYQLPLLLKTENQEIMDEIVNDWDYESRREKVKRLHEYLFIEGTNKQREKATKQVMYNESLLEEILLMEQERLEV